MGNKSPSTNILNQPQKTALLKATPEINPTLLGFIYTIGIVFDEPGEELGTVYLFGQHALASCIESCLTFLSRKCYKFLHSCAQGIDATGRRGFNAIPELIHILQLPQIPNPPNEVVKPHKRHPQHPGFRCHGLRVADIQRRKCHHMMHIQRIDADAVFLKLRLQWPFGGDVNRPMRS